MWRFALIAPPRLDGKPGVEAAAGTGSARIHDGITLYPLVPLPASGKGTSSRQGSQGAVAII